MGGTRRGKFSHDKNQIMHRCSQQSVCSFRRSAPLRFLFFQSVVKTYICAFLEAMHMVYSVQFHLFIFTFFKRLRDCSALVKRRTDGRRQGEQPERCELSQNLIKKGVCRWGGRRKRKKPAAHMCARADILASADTI